MERNFSLVFFFQGALIKDVFFTTLNSHFEVLFIVIKGNVPQHRHR